MCGHGVLVRPRYDPLWLNVPMVRRRLRAPSMDVDGVAVGALAQLVRVLSWGKEAMNLISTRKVFHFEDASGYAFDVVAEDTGRGWTATVTMRASGLVTVEDAVEALAPAAEQFLRQLGRESSENAPEIQDATSAAHSRQSL